MKIFVVLGHLQAGKTTMIQDLSGALATSGHFNDNEVVLVQNDVAFSDGAGNLDPFVTHIGMIRGCFGCQDSTQLVAKLHELQDSGCKLCILEPFGFVSGEEMLNILLKTGIPFKIMTLVNGNFPREPQVRTECVLSQLRYADAMVVTHESMTREANELIAKVLPETQLVFRRTSEADLAKLLAWVMEDSYSTIPNNLEILQSSQAEHQHPVCEVIFLPDAFTDKELIAALKTLSPKGLMRVKGSLGGSTFQAKSSKPSILIWERQSSPQPNVLVIYAEEGYNLSCEVAWLKGSVTRANLRTSGTRTPTQLNDELAAVIAMVEAYWEDPNNLPRDADGRLQVYGEEVEWINELRKNDAIEPNLAKTAIVQRTRLALLGLWQATHLPELFPEDSPVTESLAHYAITVCWFHAKRGDCFRTPLNTREVEVIATGLCRGLPHLKLGTDAAVSAIITEELGIAVKFLSDQLDDEPQKSLIQAHKEFLERVYRPV